MEETIEELREQITDLQDKNTKLADEVTDLENELDEHKGEQERLEQAADLMAELGRIHNTPKAKYDWIHGN